VFQLQQKRVSNLSFFSWQNWEVSAFLKMGGVEKYPTPILFGRAPTAQARDILFFYTSCTIFESNFCAKFL
jgi:hypothetical protein